MSLEEVIMDRYNKGSEEGLTNDYAGCAVRINYSEGIHIFKNTWGCISHFEDGYVVIGGLEDDNGQNQYFDDYAFPMECFEKGEIKFEW